MLVGLFSSFLIVASPPLSLMPKRMMNFLIFFGDCGEMHFDFVFG